MGLIIEIFNIKRMKKREQIGGVEGINKDGGVRRIKKGI